jgi:hypothetical protein
MWWRCQRWEERIYTFLKIKKGLHVNNTNEHKEQNVRLCLVIFSFLYLIDTTIYEMDRNKVVFSSMKIKFVSMNFIYFLQARIELMTYHSIVCTVRNVPNESRFSLIKFIFLLYLIHPILFYCALSTQIKKFKKMKIKLDHLQ